MTDTVVELRTFACPPRRGSAYVLVLGVAMIVLILGIGGMASVRTGTRSTATLGDADEARLYAMSGIELGRLWIAYDTDWRTNRKNGTWAADRAIGQGTFTIEGYDPLDGDLADSPHHPLLLRSIGVKNKARHIVEVTLQPQVLPLELLQYPVSSRGQVHVRSGKHLRVNTSTIFTTANLRNSGTITGNVRAGSLHTNGTINGTLTLDATALPLPNANLAEAYASLGTAISPGNTIEKCVLAPGRNPWGTPNPDGVYVFRANSDLTIKNARIHGTLVVINPGRRVTLDNVLLIEPARSDYPSLIVTGDVEFKFSSSASLSESSAGVNFNPSGAPYAHESTDTDTVDVYPSEVRGLVHVYGSVKISGPGMVRGIILSESTASSDAIDCGDAFEVIYDPKLYDSPPFLYTQATDMGLVQGSWRQSVD